MVMKWTPSKDFTEDTISVGAVDWYRVVMAGFRTAALTVNQGEDRNEETRERVVALLNVECSILCANRLGRY